MSGISAISSNMTTFSSSIGSNTALTDATKIKLQALGIDTTKITTEVQGQTALTQAQAQKNTVMKGANTIYGNIKNDAQDLASKMGVSYSTSDDASAILDKISVQLGYLQANAGNDETKLSQLNDYQTTYNYLSNELSQMQNSTSQLTTSLETLANYNKMALGLI